MVKQESRNFKRLFRSYARFKIRITRGGKSVGTWEPSSQKVLKVAERNLRFKLLSRIGLISRRRLTSLMRISVNVQIISLCPAWIHGLYAIITYSTYSFFNMNVKVMYSMQKEINPITQFPESVLTFSTYGAAE